MRILMHDNDFVSRWYKDQVKQFGYDHRALGFKHRESQTRRFEALCALGPLGGRKVLDVGCGFGDFLDFLHTRGIQPQYSGVDLCPEMIERCKARFNAGQDAPYSFEAADLLESKPQRQYDYVVASGIFGLRTDQAEVRIAPTLRKLFSWCSRGLAVNFLSRRAARQDVRSLYVDPGRMLNLAFELTSAVRLAHDYLPNDFTLFLHKTPAWFVQPQDGANG